MTASRKHVKVFEERLKVTDLHRLCAIACELVELDSLGLIKSPPFNKLAHSTREFISRVNHRRYVSSFAALDRNTRTKTCSRCETEKDIKYFKIVSVNNSGETKRSNICNACCYLRDHIRRKGITPAREYGRRFYWRHREEICKKRRVKYAVDKLTEATKQANGNAIVL